MLLQQIINNLALLQCTRLQFISSNDANLAELPQAQPQATKQ
jgi:hypothetical protein